MHTSILTWRSALALTALVALAACGGSTTPPPPPGCTSPAQCDDGNPCTADACTGGACEHAAEPADTLCTAGGGQFCDGAGACVECNRDAQCAGTSPADDCQRPACTGHACAPAFADPGAVASTQIAGDCQRRECGAAGAVVTVADDADVPDDLNECTTDACSGATPQHAATPGVPCGAGAYLCTASGDCGCQGNGDCAPPETCGGGGTPLVCGCTPTTCAAAGATCGSIADGCGATLACDDGKSPGETDADCGGEAAACATRCRIGKACGAGTDCASGHCVDGVCCDAACDGACVACTAAKKGQGSDGVCAALAAGTDPDAECPEHAAFSCGLTGACDGAAACERWPAGTVCGAASCSGATLTLADTCDGAGTCLDGGTQGCNPYVCGAGACRTSCATASDCAAGFYCAAAACVPKTVNGSVCADPGTCASGHCVDGFCCDTACNGLCGACSAALTGNLDGMCAPVPAFLDPQSECPGASVCSGAFSCTP